MNFARSIIDKREPQGIRGKAIVRDRLMMMRPTPFGPPGKPLLNKAANSKNGTTCCCGDPPCADPCTSGDCEYCTGRDVLSVYYVSSTTERWAQGTSQQPPCNQQNTCPGTPPNCSPLDVTASYQSGTSKVIQEQYITEPVIIGERFECVFGRLDPPYELLETRYRVSGVRGTLPQCAIITQPRDEIGAAPFTLSRCIGGFVQGTLGGNEHITTCAEDCVGGNQCTSQDCQATYVLHDLLCALLPHDCNNVDIAIDTGCVQGKDNGQLYCDFRRIQYNVQIGIVRN